MLRRIDPTGQSSSRVDSRTQQQQQLLLRLRRRRSIQQMQRHGQLQQPHQLRFIRQFYIIRECRSNEQHDGHVQAHPEEGSDQQQISNIHQHDALRTVDKVESWRAQHSSPTHEANPPPRQVTSEHCTEEIYIPELV